MLDGDTSWGLLGFLMILISRKAGPTDRQTFVIIIIIIIIVVVVVVVINILEFIADD